MSKKRKGPISAGKVLLGMCTGGLSLPFTGIRKKNPQITIDYKIRFRSPTPKIVMPTPMPSAHPHSKLSIKRSTKKKIVRFFVVFFVIDILFTILAHIVFPADEKNVTQMPDWYSSIMYLSCLVFALIFPNTKWFKNIFGEIPVDQGGEDPHISQDHHVPSSNPVRQNIYEQVIDVIFQYHTPSEELLQRKLNLSRENAVKILNHLECCGIVSRAYGTMQREILVATPAQAKQMIPNLSDARPTVQNIMSHIDTMEGHEFEHFTADLLRRIGYQNVEVTRGSGDQGVDVLAEKDGVRYAIQCKCYSSDLGNTPVQEVNTGKTIYRCHVGVVITNRYFTIGAKEAAEATGVLLWDRDKLEEMLSAAP